MKTSPHHRCRGFAVLLVAAMTALSGCGGGGGSSVTGKVTYKGKEVGGGSLVFSPQGEGGKSATADVKSDGTYALGTNAPGDGARVGKYKILYSPPAPDEPEDKEYKPGQGPPPSQYANLVPKQTEVEVKSGSNTIDIELGPAPKQ